MSRNLSNLVPELQKAGINSVLNSLKPRSQLLRFWKARKIHHFVMHLSYMIRSIATDLMIIPVHKFNATLDVIDLFVAKKIVNHCLVVEVRMIVTAQSILSG